MMYQMTRGLLAVIGMSALATGCLATSDEDVTPTSQPTAQPETGAAPAEAHANTALACESTPRCSLTPFPLNRDPLQVALGCGPTTEYENGYSIGFMGGEGSFCVDTAFNRKTLHAAGKSAFLPGYCSTCLTVPAGQLYVIWTPLEGPGCPSSCAPGTAPTRL